jgi:hypothetical protein
LDFRFDDRVFAHIDVIVEIFLFYIYFVVEDFEEQDLRCVLGEAQDFQAFVECAHFQLRLVVLDDSYSDLEKVNLAFQQKVVPNPIQELLTISKAVSEPR